jgi:transcriptional regulator with XRE-family HTH domain
MADLKIGRKLRELREASRLTQEQLADRAKIATRALQKVESDSGNPQLSTLVSLVQALGCEWSDVFGVSKDEAEAKPQGLTFTNALDVLKSYEKAAPFRRAVVMAILTKDVDLLDAFDLDDDVIQFVRSLGET